MANLEEYILINMEVDSDDEEDEVINHIPPRPRHRVTHAKAFSMSNDHFRKSYRLTKPLVLALIEELKPFLRTPNRASDLTAEMKVLIALNFFAKGSYQACVGNHKNANVSQASVSVALTEVVDAMNQPNIFNKYVKFPRSTSEMDAIARRYYELFRLPGVVGSIDCTHIAIFPPPNNEEYEERSYVNRKGYHSINTQLICDADLKIINVNALFPGCTHDCFIWNQSRVLPVMKEIHQRGGSYYLIGDSGYTLRRWLHIPIPEPQSAAEERYNKAFMSARSTIERCNGVLKSRFRCLLKHRVLHYAPEKASKIINSCVMLHNICISNNVELDNNSDDDDDELDFGMYTINYAQSDVEGNQACSELQDGQNFRRHIINNYFQ